MTLRIPTASDPVRACEQHGWLTTAQVTLVRFASNATRTLRMWHSRYRQRQALMHLDDRLLSDIGVSREMARAEASKPFWK